MIRKTLVVALALGSTLIATPTLATTTVTEAAKVCGRVEASPAYIYQLSQMRPLPGNFISATSGSEYVQTTVNVDGTFCFDNLHSDLHTLRAFGDGLSPIQTSVMPVEGKTVTVYLR